MKFPEQLVEKCLCKDSCRISIQGAMYDAEAGLMYTTDGKVMACVPVEKDAGDVSGIVDPDIIANARRLMSRYRKSKINGEVVGLRVKMGGERAEFPELTSMARSGSRLGYPDVKYVLDGPTVHAKSKPPTLALDIQILYDLARALCEDQRKLRLSMWIREDNNPIMVQPFDYGTYNNNAFDNTKSHGVIMPLTRGGR